MADSIDGQSDLNVRKWQIAAALENHSIKRSRCGILGRDPDTNGHISCQVARLNADDLVRGRTNRQIHSHRSCGTLWDSRAGSADDVELRIVCWEHEHLRAARSLPAKR